MDANGDPPQEQTEETEGINLTAKNLNIQLNRGKGGKGN